MLNAPLKIGRMPKTSSKIPIGAITKAILAYVKALLQVADRLGPIPPPVVLALQLITFVVIASYRMKAMNKKSIEITIPITPIPIGMDWF